MLNGLYYAHSGTRWLVVLAAVVALVFMVFSLIRNREQDGLTRGIMVTFSSLVGLQWVLGLVYYLMFGMQYNDYTVRNQEVHAAVMTGVVLVAHLYLPFRRRASTRTYYMASIGVIVLTAILIYVGVATLAGDLPRWSMSPYYVPGA
jgi:heme A synthase